MIGLGCGEAANICDTLYPVADILLYTAILVYRLVSGRARKKLYALSYTAMQLFLHEKLLLFWVARPGKHCIVATEYANISLICNIRLS